MTYRSGDFTVCDHLVDVAQLTNDILLLTVLVLSGATSLKSKVYCASSSPFDDDDRE